MPVSALAPASGTVEQTNHPRVLLVTFGSVVEPRGGLQVRSRVLAETLTEIGSPPAIVSTLEAAGAPHSPPWARTLLWPAVKPRFGCSVAFARLIRTVARDSDVLIIANAMFMPSITLAGVRLPVIWDTNECQTLHYGRLPQTASVRAKRMIWWGLERWAARRCRVAVAISTTEAGEWRRIHPVLAGRTVTVTHAPFASPRSPETARVALENLVGALSGPVLVFLGTLRAKHNAAAARWIIDVLGPALPATVTIVMCGPGSERLRPHPSGARVIGLGSVEDVDSVIAAADLCLAPLAAGAGVKTKVLHYLAHGRRVAGTPVAFEGLENAPGVYAAPLDSLAALVSRLARETETAESAGDRSLLQREWVASQHGRGGVAAQWKAVLTGLHGFDERAT